MRYLRSTIGAALAAGVLLSGCAAASTAGGGPGESGGGTPPASGTSPAPSLPASTAPSTAPHGGRTALTVVAYGATGGANSGIEPAPLRWTLTCNPVGGTHPKAAAACAQLLTAAGDPFAPTPPGLACSMIYGGPEEAHVFGTFEGRAVDTTFQRTNGCQVARWQRVSELLLIRSGAGLPE